MIGVPVINQKKSILCKKIKAEPTYISNYIYVVPVIYIYITGLNVLDNRLNKGFDRIFLHKNGFFDSISRYLRISSILQFINWDSGIRKISVSDQRS